MAQSTYDLYAQYGMKLIFSGLQNLAGKPKNIVADERLYRKEVMDAIWNLLPLPMRLMGRDKLSWEDFLLGLRTEIFMAVEGKLSLRQDAPTRMDALARRLFGGESKAPISPSQEPVPLAIPVAKPAMQVAMPVAKTNPKAATSAPPKEREPPELAIGIDLGTTYSVVAYVDAGGRPCSLPNASGDILTPSVILLDEGGPVVGKEAVMASAMEPEKVAECVKRDMGSKLYRKKVNGEMLPPEVFSSLILRALKADAERKLGPVKKAVITVPAYFDESRRAATVDAGKLAGLEVLDIINEPTAAAIAYGYQVGFLDPTTGRSATNRPIRVLVFDLGGGTFDVTIVSIEGKSFRALATDGDVALGGKDWDEVIMNLAAEKFIGQNREDPRTNPVSRQELWLSAETAKKTLTERTKATIFVNHQGRRMKVELERPQFEEATAPLLARTQATTEIVLRQAGLTWNQIDQVLLVGGSSRMPQVGRMLQQLTGKEPERSLAVDEAVAHGAALYANLLIYQGSNSAEPARFSVVNINSHSLGIVGMDPQTGRRKNQILIPKNTPLPHTVTKVFKTQKPNQPNVVIRVVEGESPRPEACIQVGVCTIANLPPQLPAGTPVQVSYSYQTNGQLQVTGQVEGQEAGATTLFQRENSMQAQDLDLWLKYVQTDG